MWPFHSRVSDRARQQVRRRWSNASVNGATSGVRSGRSDLLQQPQGLCIEITQRLGLDTVGDHRKQQMPGQVRGRLPAGHALPAGPQTIEARPRRCAISSSNVRSLLSWATELERRMVSGGLVCLCVNRMIVDPIDATAFTGFRHQIEPEPLANNASEESPHRMLLPACGMNHRLDGCAAGARSIAMIRACLLSTRPACWDDDRRPPTDCGLRWSA